MNMPELNFYDTSDIDKIQKEDLENPVVLRQLQVVADEYLKGADVGEAQEVLNHLLAVFKRYPEFPTEHSELWPTYRSVLVQLRWTALPVLTDDEVEDLFRQNLLYAFGRAVEIEEKLGGLFRIHKDVETLGYRRLMVLRGLKDNQEWIGKISIMIDGSRVPAAPTVKNWLQDYDSSAPSGHSRGVLAEENYLAQSVNCKKISAEQREIIRRLVKVYDFLRFPKLPDDIVESTSHQIPLRPVGPVIPVEAQRSTAPSPAVGVSLQVATAYKGMLAFERSVAKEAAGLQAAVGTDGMKLRAAWYAAVQGKRVAATVAALRIAAANGELERMLADDQRLKRYLIAVWPGLYGDAAAVELAEHPSSPASVRRFLRYILQERLKLEAGEAARIGAQIGNIFASRGQAGYAKLAYYDVKSKTFKWLT